MKISNLIAFVSLSALFILTACNSKKEDPVTNESTSVSGDTSAQDPAVSSTLMSGDTIHHFICPNRCKGSGGPVEAPCPVCGTLYVHNDAFHKGQPIPEPPMRIDPVTHTAVPTHTEPQNAYGVYHFICPNGHPGGAGVAGKCPKCGAELIHNQAFHNK